MILLFLCVCFYSVAADVFSINLPLAPWKWHEVDDIVPKFDANRRSLCDNAMPWISKDPFISITGPPGSHISVNGMWSDEQTPSPDAAQEVLGWSGPNLDTVLAHDVVIPSSGRACINITLPAWDTMTTGALIVLASEPGKKAVFSCAAFDYLEQTPLSHKFDFVLPGPSLRDAYCVANSTLPSSNDPCECECLLKTHLRCTGTCDKEHLESAEKTCGRSSSDSPSLGVSVSILLACLTAVAMIMTLL